MPPKTKSKVKKKSSSMDTDLDGIRGAVKDMLENRTLDEETIRSAFRAAKKGSTMSLVMLMPKLPAPYISEAVTILCTILDQGALVFTKNPSSSSSSPPNNREQVLSALAGLASVPESTRLFEENWSIIFNPMQHLYKEVFTSSSRSPEDLRFITDVLPSIIVRIVLDDEGHERLITKDDTFLTMLVRVWLTPSAAFIPSSTSRNRFLCFILLNRSFFILEPLDPKWSRLTRVFYEVLCDTTWDTSKTIKTLLQYSWDPERSCRSSVDHAVLSLSFVSYLIAGRTHDDAGTTGKFMDKAIKDGVLPLIMQWLPYIHDELEKAPSQQAVSENRIPDLIRTILVLLYRTITTQNGPRWVIRLFKLGLLSAIARILPFAQYLSDNVKENLTMVFCEVLPQYLNQRLVFLSAVEAVEEIINNGDVAKLEASPLRQPWMTFTNTLLERTVLYTACSRAFTYSSGRKCDNCGKPEPETPLFKCAGCEYAFYCSKQCQVTSWKTGGHREECVTSKEVMSSTGMRVPADNFSTTLALAEIRRHMPGLCKHLRNSANPSGVPLEDAYFEVTLKQPPVIKVRSRMSLPHEHRLHTCKRGDGPVYAVMMFGGGSTKTVPCLLRKVPVRFQWFAPGKDYDGEEKLDEPHLLLRKPARGEGGKNLAFILDEVDRHVMDARKHFQPPAPRDEESPRTIFDYIKAKVNEDPDLLAWAGYD